MLALVEIIMKIKKPIESTFRLSCNPQSNVLPSGLNVIERTPEVCSQSQYMSSTSNNIEDLKLHKDATWLTIVNSMKPIIHISVQLCIKMAQFLGCFGDVMIHWLAEYKVARSEKAAAITQNAEAFDKSKN